jgi:hypothetical protein
MKDQSRKDLLDKVTASRSNIQYAIDECKDGECDATPVMNALSEAVGSAKGMQYVLSSLPAGAPASVKGNLESALSLVKTGKTELEKYIQK